MVVGWPQLASTTIIAFQVYRGIEQKWISGHCVWNWFEKRSIVSGKHVMAPSTRGVAATAAASTTTNDSEHQPRNSPSYYLLKSEPHEFSIDQLEQCPDMTSEWDGIRNYQARNILRTMQVNDLAWFYHSSCKEPGIVGKVRVTRTVKPDATALQPTHKYYDAKSTADQCRWDSVQIQLESKYPVPLTLSELRVQAAAVGKATKSDEPGKDGEGNEAIPAIIAGMKLLQTTRLSVQPVTPEEWNAVEKLIDQKEKGEPLLTAVSNNNEKKATKKKGAKKRTATARAAEDVPNDIQQDAPAKKKTTTSKTATPGIRKSKRTKTKE